MKALWDKGVVYKGRYQGKYCVQCERFYTDDELIGGCARTTVPRRKFNPKIIISFASPIFVKTLLAGHYG